jgi:Helix-turn-helix
VSEQDGQQQHTDRPPPGDRGAPTPPVALGDPERNPMAFLFRPGNRALYRGLDDDKTLWWIDVLVAPGEALPIERTEPAAGRPDGQQAPPGTLLERYAEISASVGANSYDAAATLAWGGLELRAAPGKTTELVALLRAAAADERWGITLASGGTLSPRPRGRALLRELADAIERDGHGALAPLVPEDAEDAVDYTADGGTERLTLTGPREPRQPYIPDAFPGGTARLPNNPLIAAGMEALWKGGRRARDLVGGWSLSPSGRPVYQHNGRRGGRVLVYPNLSGHAADPLPTTDMFWSFVESLNPFTGDVVLAVLAQLCEPGTGDRPKAPLLEPVRITAQAIARYKGIQRWGMERRLLDERIFDEMERLRGLAFDVEKMPVLDPATGKWDSGGASWEGDQFFDIVKVEQWQESLLGDRERIEVSWSVRAGQWAYWWLNPQGRVYIGRMARTLLELDHQGAALAKKLGQHVVLLNDAVRPEAPLELRIDRLLEAVGELPEPASRGKDWAGRTRDRFDEALLALQEAKVFAAVAWPAGAGPGDADRTKGWAQRWLNASVRITLPESAPGALAPLPPPRRRAGRHRKALAPGQRISGGTIRQRRLERGWAQQALARHLGITVPYLSQLETGKRIASEALAHRLKVWLEAAG